VFSAINALTPSPIPSPLSTHARCMRNPTGVGVALALYDVTVAFVNCHLASKNLKQRRQQYVDLVARCAHPPPLSLPLAVLLHCLFSVDRVHVLSAVGAHWLAPVVVADSEPSWVAGASSSTRSSTRWCVLQPSPRTYSCTSSLTPPNRP
jgi:hypothetical protein